ncbi:serine/threonine-protein kinase BLUS1-like [Andrographis paniculata]|uniref:serine/threonine-protein kinase BLUS1-like n=1 Tax=Andrographis paniculata TaxID=175694 RepID=UPI0021E8F708|nr:serine/threonine-protein kinase BLUS1-like [Andrographis paniculata]
MPWLSAGSLQSLLNPSSPNGLPEDLIAAFLRHVLEALVYLHREGIPHMGIKPGNILIDSNGVAKLADLCFNSSVYESRRRDPGPSPPFAMEVSGTPYWISPEVLKSPTEFPTKSDIWSFAIVAMELAYGRCPVSEIPNSGYLKFRIAKRFQFSDHCRTPPAPEIRCQEMSGEFKNMVGLCLDEDPSKRPSPEQLLLHPFFKKSKGSDFVLGFLKSLPESENPAIAG